MTKLGILGGTFDPPHIGHLILADYSAEALGLERVLFVPVGSHPFKQDATRTTVEHRVAMTRLAIMDNARLELSRIDIDREGPHYSADMVQIVASEHPGAELYFLMGYDNLKELPTWTRPADIIAVCRFAVMRRLGEEIDLDLHDAQFPTLSERIDIVDTPIPSTLISSTYIVERLRNQQTVRYLMRDEVIAYIQANQLYGGNG